MNRIRRSATKKAAYIPLDQVVEGPVVEQTELGNEWVEVAPGRKRLVTKEDKERLAKKAWGRRKATGPKDETYEEERYRILYGEKMVVCEDLKSKEARKAWPRYRILPDGREGPMPFRNKYERRDYLRAFGFRESGDW